MVTPPAPPNIEDIPGGICEAMYEEVDEEGLYPKDEVVVAPNDDDDETPEEMSISEPP